MTIKVRLLDVKDLMERYRFMPVQVRASLWFLVCSFLQKGITVITTPIFTRLLTTEEYGQFSVFNAWLGVLTILVSMRLSAGVYQQGLIKFENEREVFSSSLQGLTFILIVVWTILYLVTRHLCNSITTLTTVQTLIMLGTIWTTAVFEFWATEQRVTYSYRTLVMLTLLVSISKPLLGVVLVMTARDKVTARVFGLLAVEAVAFMPLFIKQMRRGKSFYSRRFWSYALLYNLPLIPHYLSQTVLNNADRIMINAYVGSSEAGIYSLAYSVALVMTLFNTALTQTMTPWMYQKIKDRCHNDLAPLAYLTLIIVACCNILLIALAPEVVRFFAPSSYYEAIWIIPPVAMSTYFMYSYDLFAKYAFYYERTKSVMLASILGALLNILLNYLLLKQFGYLVAGYTTLFCYMLYSVAHYLLMLRTCDEYCDGARPYRLSRLLSLTGAFMAVGFALMATYAYPIARYAVLMLLFLLLVVSRKRVIGAIRRLMAIRL